MSDYDVIVIGSGAGGGTLVRHLAPSGKRILLLERGDWLRREPQNWQAQAVFVEGRYITPDRWYYADLTPFQPQVHYYVGGATKLYGAALYRLRAEDFGEIHHHAGISPAWPISYDEMEPYYTKAEQLYQVHGAHGEDPTEGRSSRPYPWPAVSHEPRIQQLSDDLTAAGYHPFHAPCGILLDEGHRPASSCIRCAWCDGYPCLVHAKADAEVIAVRPALASPNVTLVTGAQVQWLETSPSGREVTAVVAERDGHQETYAGDIVVVCAGAANTARILLRSASDQHPDGLANGSGQLGRNYMFHNSRAVLALSKEPNDTVYQKTLALNDFYLPGDGREWPLGNIQMLGKSNAEAMRGEEPKLTALVPKVALKQVARHGVDFWLTTEDIPRPGNRVTVDRDGRVHVAYEQSNETEAEGLYRELRTVLEHAGLATHHVLDKSLFTCMNVPLAGVAHQAGTCRFGTDPATSVLDVDCRAHELDNLYVADASFFPSIGAVNPALTIMANALRVASHLGDRLS